jgi:hypothetical protein
LALVGKNVLALNGLTPDQQGIWSATLSLEQMRRADRSVTMTATVVMGSYRPLPEPPTFVSRAAKVAKTLKLRTPAKLYIDETLLERLAQDVQDMARALRELVQTQDAVVCQ